MSRLPAVLMLLSCTVTQSAEVEFHMAIDETSLPPRSIGRRSGTS